MGSITRSGRCPGGGLDDPFWCSCLDNPHGQRSLAGYTPWGHKELGMTEATQPTCTFGSHKMDLKK